MWGYGLSQPAEPTTVRRFLDEIDIHILWMLALFIPVLWLSVWWVFLPVLVPQGRILVRAFSEYPRFGQRPWRYLAANELVVLGTAAALVGVRLAMEW
jgi:hypothetical protein